MTEGGEDAIYKAAVQCLELFELCLKAIDDPNNPSYEYIEDIRGGFNIWGAYIGAFAPAKLSLDARLMHHQDIKNMVMDMLHMIRENLSYGKT